MREGYVEPQPVRPLARLINGALLEAAFFVAASEDPASARDEAWAGMESLLGRAHGRPLFRANAGHDYT